MTNSISQEFKKKYFKLVNGVLSKKKNFLSAEISKVQEFSIVDIIIMILFCITFYLLLITVIVTGDAISIVFLILIYIIGSLIQLSIVPIPMFYYSRLEFESDLSKLLNSSVRISLNPDNLKKMFQVKRKKLNIQVIIYSI